MKTKKQIEETVYSVTSAIKAASEAVDERNVDALYWIDEMIADFQQTDEECEALRVMLKVMIESAEDLFYYENHPED